jgi:prefoldin subunit 5
VTFEEFLLVLDDRILSAVKEIRAREERIVLSLNSLHQKVDHMSKTVADVQAGLDDLASATSTALADIKTEVTALQAQITALQGVASPDFTQVLASIASIKAKVVAADPGVPQAPAQPVA